MAIRRRTSKARAIAISVTQQSNHNRFLIAMTSIVFLTLIYVSTNLL